MKSIKKEKERLPYLLCITSINLILKLDRHGIQIKGITIQFENIDANTQSIKKSNPVVFKKMHDDQVGFISWIERWFNIRIPVNLSHDIANEKRDQIRPLIMLMIIWNTIKRIGGNFFKSPNKPDDETLKPIFTLIGKKMRITTVTVTIQYFFGHSNYWNKSRKNQVNDLEKLLERTYKRIKNVDGNKNIQNWWHLQLPIRTCNE